MKQLIKKILNETVDNRIVDVLIKLNLTSFKIENIYNVFKIQK